MQDLFFFFFFFNLDFFLEDGPILLGCLAELAE